MGQKSLGVTSAGIVRAIIDVLATARHSEDTQIIQTDVCSAIVSARDLVGWTAR